MTKSEALIVCFCRDTVRRLSSPGVFPALRSPHGFAGTSVFIRPIPRQGLADRLTTHLDEAARRARRALDLRAAEELRITAPGGTDVRVRPRNNQVLPFQLTGSERHLYLPPAEVAFGLLPGTAHGTIAVDVTVGEFVWEKRLVDEMGLVGETIFCAWKRAW